MASTALRSLFCGAVNFNTQKYSELKKTAQTTGQLFVDSEFPPDIRSLGHGSPKCVIWRRPGEMVDDPRLFVEGASSDDFNQGELGNCWFVAACSNIAQENCHWGRVVPSHKEQEWNNDKPNNYAGIFKFRFWRFGQWIEVVVDDFLPTIDGRLIYCHSKERNEFWGALLEKAYAKIQGSYTVLEGGNTADALIDFTGGISESINLIEEGYTDDTDKQAVLWDQMSKTIDRAGLLSCSIRVTTASERESRTDCGLIRGHAYGVTAMRKIHLGESGLSRFFTNRGDSIQLVRIRNPWGEKEWNGPWSDGSTEWENVSSSDKHRLGITFANDGEFWMEYHDWLANFSHCCICRIPNTSMFSVHKTWHEGRVKSRWARSSNPAMDRSGGCSNYSDTFMQNPQFFIDIEELDDAVIVSLSQQDTRSTGTDPLSVGFVVMKVEVNRKCRLHKMNKLLEKVTYSNSRSVFKRFPLQPGRYVVMPTTFHPHQEGDFLLRIFTASKNNFRQLDRDVPPTTCWSNVFGYPRCMTHVHVISAINLASQDIMGGADPYIFIRCEGSKARSHVISNTTDATFEADFVFYRRDQNSALRIQVWNKNVFLDRFMGEVDVIGQLDNVPHPFETALHKKGTPEQKTQGTLRFIITTYSDLAAL